MGEGRRGGERKGGEKRKIYSLIKIILKKQSDFFKHNLQFFLCYSTKGLIKLMYTKYNKYI